VAKQTTTPPPAGGSRPAGRAKATPEASGGRFGRLTASRSATASADRPARSADRPARSANAPSIGQFVAESRSELRKVTWPTRQETMNLTAAVIAMTVGIAAFLGLIDSLLDLLVKPVLGAK